MKIAELPFVERPVLELLGFADDRIEVDRLYAGYGWARVPRIHLSDHDGRQTVVDDALVVAIHAADDGEPLPDDVDLMFELDDKGERIVSVLASQFFRVWLPQLPAASAVVLAMCNPHRARVTYPEGMNVPVHVASGDVEAWIDDDNDGRIELCTDGSWARLTP